MTPRGDEWKTRARWIVGGVIVAALAACGWLVLTDAPAYRFLVRLYVNKQFLKDTLREWGVLAPVIFMGLQVLQVVVAPIPGELTGILGGYLFGQWVGLLYSTIGLTLGSVAAFAVGRWLGTRYIQKLVSPDTWRKLGFIVEAEGAILCFVIFLAGLGLRGGLHARSHPWDVGPVSARRSHSGRRLSPARIAHCRRRRGGAAAVLLPQPPGGMA